MVKSLWLTIKLAMSANMILLMLLMIPLSHYRIMGVVVGGY